MLSRVVLLDGRILHQAVVSEEGEEALFLLLHVLFWRGAFLPVFLFNVEHSAGGGRAPNDSLGIEAGSALMLS